MPKLPTKSGSETVEAVLAVRLEVELEVGLEVRLEVRLEVGLEVGLEVELEVRREVELEVRREVGLEVRLEVGLEVGLEVRLEVGLEVRLEVELDFLLSSTFVVICFPLVSSPIAPKKSSLSKRSLNSFRESLSNFLSPRASFKKSSILLVTVFFGDD